MVICVCRFFYPGKIFVWLFLFVCFFIFVGKILMWLFFVSLFFTLVGKVFVSCLFVCFYFSFNKRGAGGVKITCVMQNSGLGVAILVYLYHMLSASSRPGALVLTRKHQAGW